MKSTLKQTVPVRRLPVDAECGRRGCRPLGAEITIGIPRAMSEPDFDRLLTNIDVALGEFADFAPNVDASLQITHVHAS